MRLTAIGLVLVCSVGTPVTALHDFSKVEITHIDLVDSLARLQRAGGYLAVSTGPDGVFLVDDQAAPLQGKLRATIAAIPGAADQPIRFARNTHWHRDPAGGDENFGLAGALRRSTSHPPAHIDGDSFVHFREANVVYIGDSCFSGMFSAMYSYFDASSGGRFEGMIAETDRALARAGPKTRIIPGHALLSKRPIAGSRKKLSNK